VYAWRNGAQQQYSGIISGLSGIEGQTWFGIHGQFTSGDGNSWAWDASLASPTWVNGNQYNPPVWFPPSVTQSINTGTGIQFCGAWGFLANTHDGYITMGTSGSTFYLDQNNIPSSKNVYSETIHPYFWADHYGSYIYFTTTSATGGARSFYGVLGMYTINGHFVDIDGNSYAWDVTWQGQQISVNCP